MVSNSKSKNAIFKDINAEYAKYMLVKWRL